MIKMMRKTLAVLLVLAIALAAVGCGGNYAEALVGKWECQEYFTAEEVTELLEASNFYPEEIEVITISELSFTKILEFKADGTYRFAYDADACRESIRAFYKEVLSDLYVGRDQLTELYGEEVTELTQADFEQGYAELFGCAGYTELLEMLTDGIYDYDGLAEDFETGTYTADSRRILTTITGETTEEYLDYTLTEGKLTLTYIDAVEEYTPAN